MARKHGIGWILGASVALALAGACSLNPQPIPPGEQEDAATPTNGKTSDAGQTGVGGGGDGSDGSFANTDGGDAGEEVDASDAGDAGEDASESGDE